jgi:hypothetical protein
MRALYKDIEEVENEMLGTAVFCTTKLERLQSDLRTRCFVWELENKGAGEFEGEILDFCGKLWRRALAGAIKLYQQAAKLPPPPKNLLPELRFRDWVSWAYRYAQVLGVADKFVAYVRKSKIAAHKGEKFEFLIDALSSPKFDPQKEYTISELIELADPVGQNLRGVANAVSTEGARDAIVTLALSMGYMLRIEKKRVKGENKPKLRFIFTPMQPAGSDRLRELLQKRGINPAWAADWDGSGAPPAEPIRQNGHAPQIAPPASEPAPIAAEGAPAGVGEGVPMAATPPAPEPVAIAVQSAHTPDPDLPTPEEYERWMAKVREALERLPRPVGLLRQTSGPLEGWMREPAPPELIEALRARACASAIKASEALENGRILEACGAWAGVCWNSELLSFSEPTREVLAGVFLARAAFWALEAAQDPGLESAAVKLAKVAGEVFLGKAAPGAILEVLSDTPSPLEFDPCKAPVYRKAAGHLVAAHWVLTGGDPKKLVGWLCLGRWEPKDAEAMLLFSLERQNMGWATGHLYLGDLPY